MIISIRYKQQEDRRGTVIASVQAVEVVGEDMLMVTCYGEQPVTHRNVESARIVFVCGDVDKTIKPEVN